MREVMTLSLISSDASQDPPQAGNKKPAAATIAPLSARPSGGQQQPEVAAAISAAEARRVQETELCRSLLAALPHMAASREGAGALLADIVLQASAWLHLIASLNVQVKSPKYLKPRLSSPSCNPLRLPPSLNYRLKPLPAFLSAWSLRPPPPID